MVDKPTRADSQTATRSESGATLMSGKGVSAVQQHIQKQFETARSLGPTLKQIRDVATDYVERLASDHISEGFEVVEEATSLQKKKQ